MNYKKLCISVIIASRGNVQGLRTALDSLNALSSGRHDISYVVACDYDDTKTQEIVTRMILDGFPVHMVCAKRRITLGSAWNEAAFHRPGDMYAVVIDRAVPVTPLWDLYLADSFEKDDTRVIWWTTNNGPVIPIIPHKWLKAAGHIFTEYFPFWFDDTWVHELSALVHGLPNFMTQAACFINKKNNVATKRLRDLRFWMDFFIAKRPERILHAARIRKEFNLPEPDMEPINQWFKSTEETWDREWTKWEGMMRDRSEPDATYIAARKAAEDFMNEKRSA